MNTTPSSQGPQGGAKILVDLGPVLVFFLANYLAPVAQESKIYVATGAFMVAMIAAIAYSAIRFRKVSTMLWFSGAMVVVLGALTIWLQNDTFIKMKPTFYYLLIAAILGFGLMTGRPLLKTVLEASFPGLNETGWHKLTRNWTAFFIVMAVVNEVVWRNFSTEFWIGFKLWGMMPLTLLFTFANVPMLMRHGMNLKDVEASDPGPVE